MKKLLLAVSLLTATHANALQYPATCRGPTATVVNIEGLDTPKARLIAHYTLPDAIAYCHYSLGISENKKPKPEAVAACAREFFETENKKAPLSAEANCKAGKIEFRT